MPFFYRYITQNAPPFYAARKQILGVGNTSYYTIVRHRLQHITANALIRTPTPNVIQKHEHGKRPPQTENSTRHKAPNKHHGDAQAYTTVTAPVMGRPFAPPPAPFLPGGAGSCLHHLNTPARALPPPPPPAPAPFPRERETSSRSFFSSCSCSKTLSRRKVVFVHVAVTLDR